MTVLVMVMLSLAATWLVARTLHSYRSVSPIRFTLHVTATAILIQIGASLVLGRYADLRSFVAVFSIVVLISSVFMLLCLKGWSLLEADLCAVTVALMTVLMLPPTSILCDPSQAALAKGYFGVARFIVHDENRRMVCSYGGDCSENWIVVVQMPGRFERRKGLDHCGLLFSKELAEVVEWCGEPQFKRLLVLAISDPENFARFHQQLLAYCQLRRSRAGDLCTRIDGSALTLSTQRVYRNAQEAAISSQGVVEWAKQLLLNDCIPEQHRNEVERLIFLAECQEQGIAGGDARFALEYRSIK